MLRGKMMKFSIVTPAYNSEKFISEAIESVISQRGNFEIEYIVVDGGSTDNTIPIVKRYKEMVESGAYLTHCNHVSMEYISEKDGGMYDAVAKGFKLVTGDITAYINSDDYYLPNSFSSVDEIFRDYPDVDWLTGKGICFNERGQIIECSLPLTYESSLIRKGIFGSCLYFIQQESIFWRTDLLQCVDLDRFRKYRYAGDFFLWYNFTERSHLFIVDTGLGGFRFRQGQLSSSFRDKYSEEFVCIADKRTFTSLVKAGVYILAHTFLPDAMKLRLNKKIIYFSDGKWTKRKGPFLSATREHMVRMIGKVIARLRGKG